MNGTGRREFLRKTTLATIGSYVLPAAASGIPRPTNLEDRIEFRCGLYRLRYTRGSDLLDVHDSLDRPVFSTPLQPLIETQSIDGAAGTRHAATHTSARQVVEDGSITFHYTLADDAGEVSLRLRLTEDALWFDPVRYMARSPVDVVSLHYFARSTAGRAAGGLTTSFLVVPGISEGSSVSPIQSEEVGLKETVWLGRGSSPAGLNQQWALPVHYFCGFSKHAPGTGSREIYSKGVSAAFTCGLADLPNGDLFLTMDGYRSTLWIDYRGDLWGHMRGPGELVLGATLCIAFADTYYAAIKNYYAALVSRKIIAIPPASERKVATMLSPQFCTWGAQVVRGHRGDQLSQQFLDTLYDELRRSGMLAKLFSIDDKWEGIYGGLEHDSKRLPGFEQFLDRVRADGHKIGLWTALMRCEEPSSLGLTLDHMLHDRDGKPLRAEGGYYLLDFTQPRVAKVLGDLCRRFMRRYKPDLVKFDFGYELPTVTQAAPADKAFMGERLLSKGLDIVLSAMREIDPDVVVMYYNLSPLYLPYFDLHGLDDIFQAYREFSYEANRRIFFSSLMGTIGVPVYGSSGYDWSSAPEIWFDSSAVGSIGSLNDFDVDEAGQRPTPAIIARYNGVARSLRTTRIFDIVPIGGGEPLAPATGAHAQSWVRVENGEPVLLARRPPIFWNDLPSSLPLREQAMRDLAIASFPLIVASTTGYGIARSTHLLVVPYGPGPIAIGTRQTGKVDIRAHYLGGKTIQQTTVVRDGWIRFTPALHPSGSPIESVELIFDEQQRKRN